MPIPRWMLYPMDWAKVHAHWVCIVNDPRIFVDISPQWKLLVVPVWHVVRITPLSTISVS